MTALVTLVGAAVAGSAVLLVVPVQTPGLSHVVRSLPLLPHQWITAGAATAAQLLVQRIGKL